MVGPLRSVLLGRADGRPSLVSALALGVFVASFGAYSLGLFAVSGGLVWVPFHAAVVGTLAGCWVGYSRRGLVFAWVVTYASLLGYHAAHAGSALSGLAEQLGYVVRLDGLAFLGVEGVVLGTIAFTLGALVRRGTELVPAS